MSNMDKDSITLSPKHGVNPSVLHCICCGKDYGVAMLGKLKGDKEAPRDMYQGLCNDCEGVINQGGCMFIEVRDSEKGNNPYRTGRVIGVSRNFKERNNIKQPIGYMEHTLFEQLFGQADFSK